MARKSTRRSPLSARGTLVKRKGGKHEVIRRKSKPLKEGDMVYGAGEAPKKTKVGRAINVIKKSITGNKRKKVAEASSRIKKKGGTNEIMSLSDKELDAVASAVRKAKAAKKSPAKKPTVKKTAAKKAPAKKVTAAEKKKFNKDLRKEIPNYDKLSNFGAAFRMARNAGQKTFTYKGKKYTTQLKSETKKTPAKKAASKKSSGKRYVSQSKAMPKKYN
jgi:hypothetical protein